MTYNKKTVEDIDVKGKRVIVRCDFNVPQNENGEITDDKRIRESIPTIDYLMKNGAKVIVCSHLGRPKGVGVEPKYSLAPVAKRLSELLGKDVPLAADVAGPDSKARAAALNDGDIILLENVRFVAGETKNDPEFSKELASLADIFVNDAFGTAHRAHSSTAGVADYLPAVCGYLIKKEIEIMGGALENPKHPFVAILGGAKVSDKIGVIKNLITKCDAIIIGGAMAYTFAKALGGQVGASRVEEDKVSLACNLIEDALYMGTRMILPRDNVVADRFAADADTQIAPTKGMPDGWMGMDIGPVSIERFASVIKNAGTIVWNGPMGVFEFDKFAEGTRAVAKAIAESNAISIIGGGDSAAAVEQLGFADKMTHISTGGGASLELLEGLELPGIACLQDK